MTLSSYSYDIRYAIKAQYPWFSLKSVQELEGARYNLRKISATDPPYTGSDLKRLALKARDKKGFTLIEVIVVLVILAILAAIAIPALTGYIDKANQRAAASQAAVVRTALQSIATEDYAGGGSGATADLNGASTVNVAFPGYDPVSSEGDAATFVDEISALTGIDLTAGDPDAADTVLTDITYTDRVLTKFIVTINGHTVTYDNGEYS
jgi:type IV pilus assembly protein PilA